MFGLGFQEIIVIAVLALVLLGPKRLPDLMRTLGKLVRDFQSATDDIKRELNKPVEEDIHPSSLPGLKPTLNPEAADKAIDRAEQSEDNALPKPEAATEAVKEEGGIAGGKEGVQPAALKDPSGIPSEKLAG